MGFTNIVVETVGFRILGKLNLKEQEEAVTLFPSSVQY